MSSYIAPPSPTFFFLTELPLAPCAWHKPPRAGGAGVLRAVVHPTDRGLFDAALSCAHVVKYSIDRIREPLDNRLSSGFVEIQTLGARAYVSANTLCARLGQSCRRFARVRLPTPPGQETGAQLGSCTLCSLAVGSASLET